MMQIKTLSLLLLLFCVQVLDAQTDDLTHDRAFFFDQSKLYQRWLDQSGYGKTLRVRTIEIEPQQLALYLEFHYANADSVAAAWQKLKTDFERQSGGKTFEQELFFKMVQIMEIRQSVGNVQLYDNYNLRQEPCFVRAIYFKDERVRVDSSGCKAQKLDIKLTPNDFSGAKKPALSAFQKRFGQDSVFTKIHDYALRRYQKKVCDNRNPKVSPPQIDGNVLRFEVEDLCKEVLKDETNWTVCEWLKKLGKPCNWIKREKLTFTFAYQQTPDGFHLKCEVEGKVGSGFYDSVKRGGYLDMEIDFKGYFEDYARNLQYELKNAILSR